MNNTERHLAVKFLKWNNIYKEFKFNINKGREPARLRHFLNISDGRNLIIGGFCWDDVDVLPPKIHFWSDWHQIWTTYYETII